MAPKKEKKVTDARAADLGTSSRRGFLKGSAGLVAGAAAAQLLPSPAVLAQQNGANPGMAQTLRAANASGRPIVLKGGMVLSMDKQVGDFEKADVVIQGKKIMAVGPNAEAPKSAVVVDAAGRIVMPGFIDTHHHQYETLLRAMVADSIVPVGKLPYTHKNNYTSVIGGIFTPVNTPDDARLAELLASLSQINAGVITTVDTSQVQLSPEHTDACIAGLNESGRRCLFNYGASGQNAAARTQPELLRLRKQYFSSDDQLLTLSSGGGGPDGWKFARSIGAPIVTHVVEDNTMGTLANYANTGLMGPDNEYIHCTRLSDTMWKKIGDTGGKVSIAPAIEMQMQHGLPPFQQALDHGIRPSLSVDVECNMTADLFTVMRTAYHIQRALANERIIAGEPNAPALITCRQAIEFGTINGAITTHLDSKVGSLTPGKEADIIMLATDRINVMVVNNIPGIVVTLMDTSNVENVFIAGKVAKWQGNLVGVDLNRLRQDTNKALDGLISRSKHDRDLFGSCCINT